MTLELASVTDKLMIIAPHCDDELLGCGGIIQRALSRGIEVKVVVVTNGDGFRWAAIRNFRRPFVSHRGFRRFGELRQQESVAALEKLGLSRENIYFFGYPDRGLQHLWQDYWHPEEHYFSAYTKAKTNPYQATHKPQREYTGKNLVEDLKELLIKYRPTKIFVSSTYDDHADHWAVYNFFHYALAQLKLDQAVDYQPDSYQYLVHRGNWPLVPGDKLIPPGFLTRVIDDWIYYPLKTTEIQHKLEAMKEYESQTKVMRQYLFSFIKDNELFVPDEEITLTSSRPQQLNYIEPTKDTKQRRKLPGVDLKQLEINLTADQLEVIIKTRKQFTARCQFRINLYLLIEEEGSLSRKITELTVTPEANLVDSNLQLISEEELIVKEVNLVQAKCLIEVLLTADQPLDRGYLFFNVESFFKNKQVDRTAWRVMQIS